MDKGQGLLSGILFVQTTRTGANQDPNQVPPKKDTMPGTPKEETRVKLQTVNRLGYGINKVLDLKPLVPLLTKSKIIV